MFVAYGPATPNFVSHEMKLGVAMRPVEGMSESLANYASREA